MAASPAERAPFGGHILRDDHRPGPASHDGRGARFVLVLPEDGRRHALDVECRALPAPDALSQALGPRAMERWGEIEVIAKLLDQPAHLVLRRVQAEGVEALCQGHAIRLARCDTDRLWRVVGCREARDAQPEVSNPVRS